MAQGDVSVTINSDIRRNINDGTVSGGVTISDGAMVFDGVNGYVSISNNLTFLNNKITTSCWFKTTSNVAHDKVMVGKYDLSGKRVFLLYMLATTDQLVFTTSPTGALILGNRAISPNAVNDGAWHYAVGVHDGDWNYLYLDGVLVASVNATDGLYNVSDPTIIGAVLNGGVPSANNHFAGSIDDVTIYNRVLTLAEISAQYAQGRGNYALPCDCLVAQYSGRDYAGTALLPTKMYDTASINKSVSSSLDINISSQRKTANDKYMIWKAYKQPKQVGCVAIEEA
jgi:hypothetical protein